MDLLCFAHRGEAYSFLARQAPPHEARTVPPYLEGKLLLGENFDVLLTGEGLYGALQLSSLALAWGNYHRVLNFGTCAGLNSKVELYQIFAIETIYGEAQKGMNFESFGQKYPSEFLPKRDLVSAAKRVQSSEEVEKLKCFAPLADREAWGLAKASHLFKIPFMAFKIVSDLPFEDVNCEIVRKEAALFSEELYKVYGHLNKQVHVALAQENEILSSLLAHPGLHFSHSMAQKLKNYCSKLSDRKNEIYQMMTLLENEEFRPKERAHHLLRFLAELTTPFNSEVKKKLNNLLGKKNESLGKLYFDQEMEKEGIGLQWWIAKEGDRELALQELSRLPLKEILSIQRGQND